MTINGKDVRLSEFEYLYNKNNQQQIEKEPLDKYVELFVLYKQKVADAEAAGIDLRPRRSSKGSLRSIRNNSPLPIGRGHHLSVADDQ